MKQPKDYRFVEKWSPLIATKGYTPMPNLLIAHQKELGITNGEMVILLDLLLYKWDNKHPFPSVATLAKSNGMALETIRRHIRSMEKKDLIKRLFRKANSNEYNLGLLIKRLEGFAQVDAPPTQKRIPPSSEISGTASSKLNTKEDAAKKTNLKSSYRSSNPTSLGEMFREIKRRKNG